MDLRSIVQGAYDRISNAGGPVSNVVNRGIVGLANNYLYNPTTNKVLPQNLLTNRLKPQFNSDGSLNKESLGETLSLVMGMTGNIGKVKAPPMLSNAGKSNVVGLVNEMKGISPSNMGEQMAAESGIKELANKILGKGAVNKLKGRTVDILNEIGRAYDVPGLDEAMKATGVAVLNPPRINNIPNLANPNTAKGAINRVLNESKGVIPEVGGKTYYHASTKNISEFIDTGKPTYFSSDKKFGNKYIGNNSVNNEVKLNLKKTITLDNKTVGKILDDGGYVGMGYGNTVKEVTDSFNNSNSTLREYVFNELKRQGYDSAVILNDWNGSYGKMKSTVVLDPKVISQSPSIPEVKNLAGKALQRLK